MARAVSLRLTVAFVSLQVASLGSTDCGGNDVVDSSDASKGAFDASRFEAGGADDASDAMLADRPDEMSTGDASLVDVGADVEAASPDAADSGADAESVPALALGAAKPFAVLAYNTITNVGATTAIIGDVGISPGTALVNLPPGQVTGTLHLGDAVAAQAEADLALAYNDLAGRPCQHTMSGVDLGGETLAPGVYCFAAGAAQTVGDLVLDGQGDSNAVWVFQIGSTLTIATNASTTMINSGNACNVYWQVGSSATINTGAHFKGNVLADVSISLLTGANVSPGRTLTQTAAVSLDSNAISNAGCP